MSTISNERLEKLSEYDCADRYEVMSMATELLALRKEREKEESAVCPKCGNTGLADSGGVQPWGEPILIECDCTAPPAPVVSDVLTRLRAIVADPRALPRRREWISGQQYSYVLLENVEAMVDDACRAAILKSGHDEIGSWSNHKNTPTDKPKSEMSQKAEQLVRDTTALAVALSAETDTTSQQFESLAGKAVGGWIPCGERMPEIGEEVLMRISCNDHFNIESGKYKGDGLWLGCWFSTYGKKGSPYQVTHWMPIPAAPEPCK
ncbi:DUF551 domain-containing protein [Cronobacter sakazakii]|uniref:DUF551 domain-containing protein n=1 Tax=Cronobacter sakazakii TaxID=28141 RepID=UPI0029CA5B42|nr:DUF551 domain-containing protein [Cronobacter sakazakii]ELY2791094.1 DUF551 domain-containing protein [Cronobacter sakazakii]ELY6147085.1 DUF551 domain-containing protein [Cronobacter sakazakii]